MKYLLSLIFVLTFAPLLSASLCGPSSNSRPLPDSFPAEACAELRQLGLPDSPPLLKTYMTERYTIAQVFAFKNNEFMNEADTKFAEFNALAGRLAKSCVPGDPKEKGIGYVAPIFVVIGEVLLRDYDADKDGKLSEAEEAKAVAMLNKMAADTSLAEPVMRHVFTRMKKIYDVMKKLDGRAVTTPKTQSTVKAPVLRYGKYTQEELFEKFKYMRTFYERVQLAAFDSDSSGAIEGQELERERVMRDTQNKLTERLKRKYFSDVTDEATAMEIDWLVAACFIDHLLTKFDTNKNGLFDDNEAEAMIRYQGNIQRDDVFAEKVMEELLQSARKKFDARK